MSYPSEKAKSTISIKVDVERKIVTTVQHLQQSTEEAQPSGLTDIRDVLRVRKPKKKKKKLKKKKKRVPRKIFYYDSDEGSEERVVD